eukprot:symbB.v1.2.000951.t1/scaffold45.1/size390604/14
MGAGLCSTNLTQGAFASCAVCNTVDAADWIFCLDTKQVPIKKKRRAKDKYAKETEEIDIERIEDLTLELFKAHDLNDDGLLQEHELINLNVRIAMLHHDKAAVELQDVRDTYQRLFRTKLDHQGRPVRYDIFRRYARGVLEELDPDPEAQEMILEQFVAEARAGRDSMEQDCSIEAEGSPGGVGEKRRSVANGLLKRDVPMASLTALDDLEAAQVVHAHCKQKLDAAAQLLESVWDEVVQQVAQMEFVSSLADAVKAKTDQWTKFDMKNPLFKLSPFLAHIFC